MLAIPLLTFQLIAVEVGRNQWENVKLELHLSLLQYAAPMEKLLQLFRFQVLLNVLVVSQDAFMLQLLLPPLNALLSI
jgi:hypothetical protein